MTTATATVHPSGWFSYTHTRVDRESECTHYEHCRLLQDLDFERHNKRWMPVTMHDDAACKKDVRLNPIVESGDGQLVGWAEDGDQLLMDLYYK